MKANGGSDDNTEAAMARLVREVQAGRTLLFVGAGISMCVGLPSWRELSRVMAEEIGMDPEELATPESFRTLAEHYRAEKRGLESVRSWMLERWNPSAASVADSEVHRHIVELGFPIIYTTNYDRNLEVAFEAHGRPYAPVVTLADLAGAPPEATKIMKFHGDVGRPETLVITESDYFDRMSFDAPLDVKLRADAFEYSILFIGYSLSDPNVRMLLYRLQKMWQLEGGSSSRPRCYVFHHDTPRIELAALGHWGVTLLRGIGEDPQDALLSFLRRLRREGAPF